MKASSYLLLLKDLWLLICILGNAYQVIQISDLYFRYDVVTIVNIDFPKKMQSPAFTVCLYTVDIIKWPEAVKLRPQLITQLEADKVNLSSIETSVKVWGHDQKVRYDSLLVNGRNTKEVFSITLSHDDLFFNCTYLSNETYLINTFPNCSDVFKISPFFKECFKCFTFDSLNRSVYEYLPAMKAIGKNGFLNSVKIRDEVVQDRCENSPVYFSEAGTLPRSSSSIFITPLNQTVLLTVDSYESFMLPAPYVSRCINYDLQGMTGDDHCYECCARNESVKVFNGSLFPGPCISERCEDDMISIDEIIKSGNTSNNKNQMMLEIQKRCQKVCAASDCKKRIVIPSILSTSDADDNIFISYVQQTPDIVTQFIPTLDIIEFLTQVSSTFGVWAGLSFFSLYDLFNFMRGKMKFGKRSEPEISQRGRRTTVKSDVSSRRPPFKRHFRYPAQRSFEIESTKRNIFDDRNWMHAEKSVLDIGPRNTTKPTAPCVERTIGELLKLRNNSHVSTRSGTMMAGRRIQASSSFSQQRFN